mmetsp:Transcript_18548/g.53477  ORF Transcript_18548/g.53477 Transcript_18548/m.53477 type:complete len:227 (+) Transcript_18548:875-1555(+)
MAPHLSILFFRRASASNVPLAAAAPLASDLGATSTRIPIAAHSSATSAPILPNPTMPAVLPRSPTPVSRAFSQRPSSTDRDAALILRAHARTSARACSATAAALAPAAVTTGRPASAHAARSMLSHPVPALPTTRTALPPGEARTLEIMERDTVLADRTTKASYAPLESSDSSCSSVTDETRCRQAPRPAHRSSRPATASSGASHKRIFRRGRGVGTESAATGRIC